MGRHAALYSAAARRAYAALAVVAIATLAILLGNTVAIALESDAPSVSVGTPARGRLEHGKRLPTAGANFRAYSRLGAALGRTAVHGRVRDAVLEAYAEMARTHPDVRWTYGETGWPSGGRLRPHRTHQNGLSVDFMMPVRDAAGAPASFPTAPWRRFGYDLEFDRAGRAGGLQVDFAAVSAHLAALARAARRHGLTVDLVIVAPEYRARLRRDDVAGLPFMRGRPWVRHDEHYHVDFRLVTR